MSDNIAVLVFFGFFVPSLIMIAAELHDPLGRWSRLNAFALLILLGGSFGLSVIGLNALWHWVAA